MAGASISIYEFDSVVNTFIKMHGHFSLTKHIASCGKTMNAINLANDQL